MLGIQVLDLDIMPDYIFFVAPCTKADGTKINPTVDNLIIYEEDGTDAAEIVAADEIANSPFDPVQLPTDAGKTGLWGINIVKTNFTAGKFYLFYWEMTIDGVETHATEKFFFRTTSQMKADVTTLATTAALNNHDTKLDTVDDIVDRILTATEVRQSAVNDAGATSTKFITTLVEAVNDFWNRGAILFTSGNNTGQIRAIKNYVGGTREVTLQTPLHIAPADGDTFVIVVARKFLVPDVDEMKITIDKLDDTLENDAGTYRFTENALEEAPSGGTDDYNVAGD